MKPYNPIKVEEKIMSEPLTKDEKQFVDSFTLDETDFIDVLAEELDSEYVVNE